MTPLLPEKRGTGMVLGKFLPPHLGHVYLVDFARRYCEDLTVVVGTLEREPIPGRLRFAWMRELFPDARVVHLTDENPQTPDEHPRFWDIWRESLQRVLPSRPDFVFASEPYGERLAKELGARFIPVDLPRTARRVSGTAIREDPMRHWEMLPACVRPYYVRRVCVFGPESTGKTTLASDLAAHLGTVWVPEYARAHLEQQEGRIERADLDWIARGQAASEDALARQANRVLVQDTDLLLTTVWSEALYGECSEELKQAAHARCADLYLLTDVDVPWVADPVRYLPDERRSFYERCEYALEAAGVTWVRVSGNREERLRTATKAVEEMF